VIREGFQLIYEMNLHLPARFVLLDKAIAMLASVGTELYPDFNVFEVAKPYARDLMVQRFSPGRVAREARREARDLARILRAAPYQVHDILESLREGRVEVRLAQSELDEITRNLDVAFNRLVIALVVAAGLIGSSFLAAAATGPGLQMLSAIGFGLSLALGVWLMWGVIRHGRL
jgi:ubiquinone biosynthesis protein